MEESFHCALLLGHNIQKMPPNYTVPNAPPNQQFTLSSPQGFERVSYGASSHCQWVSGNPICHAFFCSNCKCFRCFEGHPANIHFLLASLSTLMGTYFTP